MRAEHEIRELCCGGRAGSHRQRRPGARIDAGFGALFARLGRWEGSRGHARIDGAQDRGEVPRARAGGARFAAVIASGRIGRIRDRPAPRLARRARRPGLEWGVRLDIPMYIR